MNPTHLLLSLLVAGLIYVIYLLIDELIPFQSKPPRLEIQAPVFETILDKELSEMQQVALVAYGTDQKKMYKRTLKIICKLMALDLKRPELEAGELLYIKPKLRWYIQKENLSHKFEI